MDAVTISISRFNYRLLVSSGARTTTYVGWRGIAARGHVQRTISKCWIVRDALVNMFSCNLCDFLLHPFYVHMPKDRVPLLPHPFPVHRVCSLILLTGLANDPYLVYRKIMKLREKERREHYIGPCFVSTYTPAIVCRIDAVKSAVESHFVPRKSIKKFNLPL